MFARLAAIALSLGLCAAGAAQVQFSRDTRGSVATARRLERPLMIYVRDRSQGASCCKSASSHLTAELRDPAVVAVAREFIRVEISPANQDETLRKWGLPPNVNHRIVFAADDGTLLAQAGMSARAIVDAARDAHRKFAEHLWNTRYSPALADASTSASAQVAALAGVRRHRIRAADAAIAKLLEGEALDRGVRRAAYETLASLSTPVAVEALVECTDDDAFAAKALEACTADAVTPLLKHLSGEDEPRRLLAYKALAKICRLRYPKADAFWSNADAAARDAEIERVKEVAKTTHPATATVRDERRVIGK